MATVLPLNPPTADTPPIEPADKSEIVAEQSLIALTTPGNGEGSPVASTPAARLPVELDVGVPVREFRVHNLLALEPGAVIESRWGHGEDVPLFSGDVQLAWSEFEIVETQLAVRLTRLA
jgi:flagellar motor switch/type III secretory pathway protein FliN